MELVRQLSFDAILVEKSLMICLRCGYCCRDLDVAIVNPLSILPDGTIDPDDRQSMIFKPAGAICSHLAYQEGLAVCGIHDLDCYEGTPCQQFVQFGREEDICILGSYMRFQPTV